MPRPGNRPLQQATQTGRPTRPLVKQLACGNDSLKTPNRTQVFSWASMNAPLFLLAFLTRLLGYAWGLGQMHHEPRPRLLLVPLEPEQVGVCQFVIRLHLSVSQLCSIDQNYQQIRPAPAPTTTTYPLLVCLVDGVQRILYRDTLHVPRRQVDAEREVEVNLLDRGGGEELLEDAGVLNRRGRRVYLPVDDLDVSQGPQN